MIATFILIGSVAVSVVNTYVDMTAKARQEARLSPVLGASAEETALPAGATPRKVTVGLYVDRIASVSITDSNWSVDLYLWFRWAGDGLEPGETFKIVDGDISSKEKLDESVSAQGEHYVLYRVSATLTKFFDVSRFPLDDHLLSIAIEDQNKTWDKLEYVPDTAQSNISSRVKMPGFAILKTALTVKTHGYKSNFGNPQLANGRAVYSQLQYVIWNGRPGYGFYSKIFIGMFSAVLIALLSVFFVPNDATRISLSIGGFFGAAASMVVFNSAVPQIGLITLMDMINSIGLVTIFLTAVQSTIALRLCEAWESESLLRWFDRLSFAIMGIGYVIINVWLPAAAHLTATS